ncbi:hypothetical protein LWI29_003213 [Acer saccharum]|uniref:Uncharacterized protein n=1 Tax=Acer saccharum TaxID=4024 RepID=A0AA39VSG3_ACESA|nr:hypothetical protein LWI29_003213 [Acer saccharum]
MELIRAGDSRDTGKRNTKDKGKVIWVRRPKHRAMCPTPINAKVVLDKRSQLNKEDYNGNDSSTSSDEEQDRGLFSDSCPSRGESSIKVSKSIGIQGPGYDSEKGVIRGREIASEEDGEIHRTDYKAKDDNPMKESLISVILNIDEISSQDVTKVANSLEQTSPQNNAVDNVGTSGTPNVEENVLSLTEEVKEQGNGEHQTPIVTKKTRGKKKDLPSKLHSMQTRMSRNREKKEE